MTNTNEWAWQERRLDEIAANCAVEGWDSYGAAPVTSLALDASRRFFSLLSPTPSNGGGVQVEVHVDGYDLEIEWDAEGKIKGFYWERNP